jgi:hypothetical protein
MTVWFLIVIEWVMVIAGVALAEYALRRRMQE